MANRRMFSRSIIESDGFYRMPPHAQILYIHLCLAADDEGFVSEVEKIRRQQRAREDHIEILINQGLITMFPGKICLIMHWRQHNNIRKDRSFPSSYRALRERIFVSPENSYMVAGDDDECATYRADKKLTPLTDLLQYKTEQNDNPDKKRKEKDKNSVDQKMDRPSREEVEDFFRRENLPDGGEFYDCLVACDWDVYQNGHPIQDWITYARQWSKVRAFAIQNGKI